MATFGWTNTTIGDNVNIYYYINAIKQQMGATDGVAQSMTIYAKNATENHHMVKCALYDNSKNLIASTDATEILSTSYQSYTLNFPSPKPTLEANQYYYLAAWSNKSTDVKQCYVNMTWGAGYGPTYYEQKDYDLLDGEYPASLNFGDTTDNYWLNIYCTYTTTGTSTTQAECEAAGGYWYNGTCNATPYFETVTYASGYLARYYKRQMVGHNSASGDVRSVELTSSGQVKMALYGYNPATGTWLPINVNTSGCVAIAYCASGGVFS